MNPPYTPPVSRLLTWGEASDFRATWPDYITGAGLADADVSELVRLATDLKLDKAKGMSAWAPVHAWRALGQLRATDAIAPLITLMHLREDDDFAAEDLPEVMALMGAPAISPLAAYIADRGNGLFPRAGALEALVRIGKRSRSLRGEVVTALAAQLARFATESPDLNAFVVAGLVDLDDVATATLIEEAYAADAVELNVCGDWEEVQLRLGLIAQRSTPRPSYKPRPGSELASGSAFDMHHRAAPAATPRPPGRKSKQKAKQRIAKASRRKNRRRR